jgi:hypothetical protein
MQVLNHTKFRTILNEENLKSLNCNSEIRQIIFANEHYYDDNS